MPYDKDSAATRADLFRFIAACYYEPCAEFAEERLFDSLSDAAGQLDGELAAHAEQLGEQFVAEGIEPLLLDYTRLFLGPNDILAKPYGSVWLSGEATLMQDSTMAVLALYEQGGFDMDEAFRELPDHIAVELEFLYLLILREITARQLGADAAAAAGDLRRRFLSEHLARWIGPFCQATRQGAQTAFYRELALLTERAVTLEAGLSRQ